MDRPFEPSRVTKPIQLLAAWLLGLVLINTTFLTAATRIEHPTWAAGALVVATIANVPLFLMCLFLLQTRFRPEMQEDSYYNRYLERRYSAETSTTELVEVAAPVQSKVSVSSNEGRRRRDVAGQQLARLEADERGYVLRVNDLLPSYGEIVRDLKKSDFELGPSFGSISTETKLPEKFILSVGTNTPVDVVQRVFRLLSKYNINGVSLANTDHQGTVYIGSYIYEKGDTYYKTLTPDLKKALLRKNLTQDRLEELLSEDTDIPDPY